MTNLKVKKLANGAVEKWSLNKRFIWSIVLFIICFLASVGLFVFVLQEIKKERQEWEQKAKQSQIRWDLIKALNEAYKGIKTVTMYTSTPSQTDSSPCLASRNFDICRAWQEGISVCASNDFPIDTVIFIGGKIHGSCVIKDRMNKRFKNRIDWYGGFDKDCLDNYHPGDICPHLFEAQKFGVKKLPIYVWN
jgi:hypothetical protein